MTQYVEKFAGIGHNEHVEEAQMDTMILMGMVSFIPMRPKSDTWNAYGDFNLAAFHALIQIVKRTLKQLVDSLLTQGLMCASASEPLTHSRCQCVKLQFFGSAARRSRPPEEETKNMQGLVFNDMIEMLMKMIMMSVKMNINRTNNDPNHVIK